MAYVQQYSNEGRYSASMQRHNENKKEDHAMEQQGSTFSHSLKQQFHTKESDKQNEMSIEHSFGRDSTKEIADILADLEKNPLLQKKIDNLSTINEPFNKINDGYLTLALKIVENANSSTKEKKESQNLSANPPKEEEGNALEDLLKKTLVGHAKYDIPENISALKNPLEIVEKNQNSSKNSVKFVDKYSNKEIEVPLSQENTKKLVEKFGSLEKASEYIQGWYYEAAYAVGYLKSDSDGSGKLSYDEVKSLKSLVVINGENAGSYRSLKDVFDSDEKINAFLDEFGFIDSIDRFINHSISQDKDLSGTLDFEEIVGKNSKKVASAIANGDVGDIFVLNRLILGASGDNLEAILALFDKREEAKPKEDLDAPEEMDSKKNTQEDTKPTSPQKEKTAVYRA